MTLTQQDRLERQKTMYGITVEELEEWKEDSLMDDLMYSMSLLSDAQFHIYNERPETARQLINQAKYFISKRHKLDRELGRF